MPSHAYARLVALLVCGFLSLLPPVQVTEKSDRIAWQFSQASAQSAGDITEKEAFDSAKELGTIEAWEAFLNAFPTGFRADLARAYVRRLGSVRSNAAPRGVRQPTEESSSRSASPASPIVEVSPIEAFELEGYYRLTPRSDSSKVLNNQASGKPEVERVKPQWSSGQWQFEEVAGTPYARIKNRWKRTYLQVEGSRLQVGSVQDDDEAAYWLVEAVNGKPYVRIKSRANGRYLVANGDEAEAARADVADADSHWQLVPVGGAKSPIASDTSRAAEKPAKTDSKRCRGGTWRNGKCVRKRVKCASGYKRRKGKCVLIQNCGANAYRSPEGDCYCKKNYEMRSGKCVWKTNKQGFEVAPWNKPGCKTWERQCNQGNSNACLKYEQTCQPN